MGRGLRDCRLGDTAMRTRFAMLAGCLALAGCALLAVSARAQSVSPEEFDLSCAITSGAEMGAKPQGSAEQSAALMVFTFYLGRLTARDEKTSWNDVIKGRIAELREKARLENVYTSCMNF